MKTIISKDEYKRRKRLRDREYQKKNYHGKLKAKGKLTKKEQIELQMKKIKSLRKQGFKNKEISQELNITPKTLERYITTMKKSGLL